LRSCDNEQGSLDFSVLEVMGGGSKLMLWRLEVHGRMDGRKVGSDAEEQLAFTEVAYLY
jgi:hypothetical protein